MESLSQDIFDRIYSINWDLSRVDVLAQTETDEDTIKVVDTVLYNPLELIGQDAPIDKDINYEKYLIQNPTRGLFKSMVVPGWGQYGNKKYVKGTVMFAADLYFIARAIHFGKEASNYLKLYEQSSITIERNDYYDSYQSKRDDRNKYLWYAIIVSFESMFDAYVDAHLSGAPSAENDRRISFDIDHSVDKGAGLYLSYSF